MNGWKAAGSGVGGTGAAAGLVYRCGLWGLLAVVVVVLVVLHCVRWVLSDDRRTERYVAARTGKRLPPSTEPVPSANGGPPGRSGWSSARRHPPASS